MAYWLTVGDATRELRVFDVTAPDQDTSLTTLGETERGAAVAWSADRTGLLVVVESNGAGTAYCISYMRALLRGANEEVG